MELTRNKTKLLCAATWWPPIYMGLFMVVWCIGAASMFGFAGASQASEPVATGMGAAMSAGMIVLFALHAFTMLEGLALLVIYLMHVLTTQHLESNDRVLWAVVVCMTGPIGQLMYFYLKLRHMPFDEAPA